MAVEVFFVMGVGDEVSGGKSKIKIGYKIEGSERFGMYDVDRKMSFGPCVIVCSSSAHFCLPVMLVVLFTS